MTSSSTKAISVSFAIKKLILFFYLLLIMTDICSRHHRHLVCASTSYFLVHQSTTTTTTVIIAVLSFAVLYVYESFFRANPYSFLRAGYSYSVSHCSCQMYVVPYVTIMRYSDASKIILNVIFKSTLKNFRAVAHISVFGHEVSSIFERNVLWFSVLKLFTAKSQICLQLS